MTNVDKVKTSDHDIFHGDINKSKKNSDMTVKRVTQQYTGQKLQSCYFVGQKQRPR